MTAPSSPEDTRPHALMAAALRRDIAYGHLPPGADIPRWEYGGRYHVSPTAAHKVVKALEDEGLVWSCRYHSYAAPAGKPAPAVAARLGAVLARLRETAGRDPACLAVGRWDARHVTAAEGGTWQPRDFWAAMDTALGADGTLLKVHDNYYAGPVPAAPDPGPPDPGPPPSERPPRDADADAALIAGLIAARLTAGEWPPGAVLPAQQALADQHATTSPVVSKALRGLAGRGLLTSVPLSPGRYAYLVPSTDHPAPVARALAAVILQWDDGTRTRVDCSPRAD